MYAVLGFALGAAVWYALHTFDVGGGHALFFAVAPDIAFLYGIAPGLAKGQWATHIATDRALGFGPRDRQGFQRG
jgi:hypothetical protein